MNCPVCNRNNAVSLSICPGCGTMVGNSARADIINKIAAAKSTNIEPKLISVTANKPDNSTKNASQPEAIADKSIASSISTKLTSPTLVEFHTDSATVPEWRLQLQNTIRQRSERGQNPIETKSVSSRQPNLVTKGATALKIEPLEEMAAPEISNSQNSRLASALQRIENSRQKFLAPEEAEIEESATIPEPVPAKTNKNYPFYIASKTSEADVVKTPVNTVVKTPLANTSLRAETKDSETTKLPLQVTDSVSTILQSSSVSVSANLKVEESNVETFKVEESKKVETVIIEAVKTNHPEEIEVEEDDDSAPFAMRFNAGLFDLIIGSFLSLILLAPFMLMTEGWLSTAGIFAFLATCAVVMFTYLTTTISMHGKTFGMRLFSLELIDAEGENYPTLHQAAVSSAVYLLSLAFGGAGFLTLLFNEEKRAAHDLVSGTVIVKEF